MKFENLKELYMANGYVWTPHLEAFVREHAGTVLQYPHAKTGEMVQARLCRPELIGLGRKYGEYKGAAEYLGEEVAPVGDCNNGSIDLLLTEKGRLVGVADYLLLCWGTSGNNEWRASLTALVSGTEPTRIGVIDDE